MNNKEVIKLFRFYQGEIICDKEMKEALDLAIKALEKDKCSSCKHYDKDYGETCLNPEGTCRVFEYDGYEDAENDIR